VISGVCACAQDIVFLEAIPELNLDKRVADAERLVAGAERLAESGKNQFAEPIYICGRPWPA
jgi:hypothetical protein